jgi:hypothetical protein
MMHMYPPLAAISLVEWNTLVDYARQHDSETGTTDLDCYDAHALDVIQVLTIRLDQSGPARVGAVRVMYAPDRADGIHGQSLTPAQFTHPLPPEIHAQLHALHGRETVIVRVLDGLLSYDTPEDEAAAMSIGEAAQFFWACYRTVIGHSLTSFTARGTDLSISPNSAPSLPHAIKT